MITATRKNYLKKLNHDWLRVQFEKRLIKQQSNMEKGNVRTGVLYPSNDTDIISLAEPGRENTKGAFGKTGLNQLTTPTAWKKTRRKNETYSKYVKRALKVKV